MHDELIHMSAARVVDLLQAGELRPSELVEASIRRIEATDGALNALPVHCFERAREQARVMEQDAQGSRKLVLGGLPIVVKDNNDVGGVGTSGGTPIFRDRMAAVSDRCIAQLERNGAIPMAKSNLSELGGANTTNRLFGATRNPWNTALTCGGSSGGSAVAVATGQSWLAHGNDLGGSLRIPPAFCGVTGLRPTPGRIARKALSEPFDSVVVDGPIARSIEDLALMFDGMVGFDAGDFLTAPSPDGPFRPAARAPRKPTGKLAFCLSPGDLTVTREIVALCEQAVKRLGALGVRTEAAQPDISGTREAISVLRGDAYATTWELILEQKGDDAFTAEVLADIRRGQTQRPQAVRDAQRWRMALYRRVTDFLQEFDFFICPATQVLPFPVEQRWPREIDGVAMTSYLDWISINYVWSLVGCPVLAIPIGTSASGLPVGLQVMGPPRSEAALLAFGAWIERELWPAAKVIDPRS